MTTAWVDITDARIAANKPGTTGLMTDIRNDLRHLKERADDVGTASAQAVLDDFAAEAIDGDIWTSENAGTGVAPSIQPVGHYAQLQVTTAGDYSNLLAATKKMRVRLTDEQSVIFGCRAKTTDDGSNLAFGLQDIAMTGANGAGDTTDFIGVIHGSAGKWKVKVNKAGAGTTSGDLGNVANWTKFLFSIVKGPSSLVVDAYIDDAQISGFPVSSNVPDTVTLRPVLAISGNGDAGIWRIDYCLAFWTARPVSAV